MLVYKSVLLLTFLVFRTSSVSGHNQLHIGGIFPIAGKGGWQGGQACMPAAYLALEDVNKKKDLLPDFQLTLHNNDSEAMLVYKSVLLLTFLVFRTSSVSGHNQLHIGGIFPIAGKGGWQGGQACMPAAYLALEDVNKKKDLLPDFQLTLHNNDSEVSHIK
ncbi:hypothetical protein PVAND_006121 [Polypedilum vanderplanki]|uniref:Uncharacterized protein n=1 Tax=Polypedilum vanderplanki TaxID=319348 RepID=A0A9J6C259_POLVA|nr:hypothetical protein PVAND_006121 [Polypedilum vanderplanki]